MSEASSNRAGALVGGFGSVAIFHFCGPTRRHSLAQHHGNKHVGGRELELTTSVGRASPLLDATLSEIEN
jgi:hypothetical protein